jgi:hypothetical protein
MLVCPGPNINGLYQRQILNKDGSTISSVQLGIIGLDHNMHDIVTVQNDFIVVDEAFDVVVTLIDILQCPYLPLIWLYISNYVV